MLTLGAATVERVIDLDPFALPLGLLFPGAEIEAIRDAEPWLAPHHVDFAAGNVLLGVQSHLLRVGGLTILIDACVGEHNPRPRRADWHDRAATGYLARLAASGVRAEDVDLVLCTHLHADHVGWNTRRENGTWVPTFPRARYIASRGELDHWAAAEAAEPGLHNHGAWTDSIAPIIDAGRMEAMDDGASLGPGLSLMPLPGHSPGQVGLCLRHAGGRAIFCGDAIHSPAQLRRPDWCSAFCADRDQAVATRIALLEDAHADGALILPAHLRGPLALRAAPAGEAGWRPDFV
ncbi:MAG: MBL fold metallo-hydrolase [Rhodobacteraceae bacterium]|nr:MBL fold metallo-hydrolase [Paracoccaceae bacterium]